MHDRPQPGAADEDRLIDSAVLRLPIYGGSRPIRVPYAPRDHQAP